ncbi:MAG: hypothetical protein WBV82_22515 [Myxococcaceae bacterium]
MSSTHSWPELSWNVSSQRVQWLIDRTKEMGDKARAFELALEACSEAGEVPLSKVADELELWERTSANVWMYVGLGEGKQVAADDVPAHAEELQKVWLNLCEQRQAILQKLEAAAARVLAREAVAKVEYAHLLERAGELPSFGATVDALGTPQNILIAAEVSKPVTGDELRQRHAAEAKALPEPADFKSLVHLLPPPWVQSIFESMGLEIPRELLTAEASKSRSALHKQVLIERMSPELLKQALLALNEPARSLLLEMVNAGGAIRYAEACQRYGRDDADGFFWLDRSPSGPIAHLRRAGFAFVGMSGARQLLVVPADLVGPIRELLA